MSMVFALVLLGCADDGMACERLTAAPERYASKARCEARQEDALASEQALKADYPTVIARCLRGDSGATIRAGMAALGD
jgi:hypothetical protein